MEEPNVFYLVLTQFRPHTSIVEICYTQKLAEKIYEQTKRECIEDEASTHLMLVKAFVASFNEHMYTYFTMLSELADNKDLIRITNAIDNMIKYNDAIVIKEEDIKFY